MSEVRTATREDMDAVAALFQVTFRNDAGAAPLSLVAYLAEAFLDHPWYDPEIASRVHLNDEGRVTGFIGVFPGRFAWRGRILKAAIAGSLMVEDPAREPLAGARLLRAVVRGPQDMSISETANLISQRLWEPLGGRAAPSLSLDWFHPFRPAAMAVALAAERRPAASRLSSVARLLDGAASRWARARPSGGGPSAGLATESDPPVEALTEAVHALGAASEPHPAWSADDLAWFLRQAILKARYGVARSGIVRDRKGALVGCYLFHGKAGGVGRALVALARPGAGPALADILLERARETGLAGLRGRLAPVLADALLTRGCLYLHRASTMVHSADPELMAVLQRGEGFVTGLAAESWTRLVGDEFR